MDKSKFYLDLLKCSEEEHKHVISLLPKPKFQNQYEITKNEFLLSFDTNNEWWVYVDEYVEEKKELTYPEFIKLFEGGEEENNGWISVETKPDKFQDVILYREDAGVFTGYYGNLAETLSEKAVEELYDNGVSEKTMWQEQFFYFGIEGHGILELDTEPTHWMPLPEPPKF